MTKLGREKSYTCEAAFGDVNGSDASFWAQGILACPVCGGAWVHVWPLTATGPSCSGDSALGLKAGAYCEQCDAGLTLIIETHEGQTQVQWEVREPVFEPGEIVYRGDDAEQKVPHIISHRESNRWLAVPVSLLENVSDTAAVRRIARNLAVGAWDGAWVRKHKAEAPKAA